MGLFIQDKFFKDSVFLNEVILSQFPLAVEACGSYAFASQSGIDLIFGDEDFVDYIKYYNYTLVVGMDSITDQKAISSLRKYKKKFPNLSIYAYIHKDINDIYHPKFSLFKYKKSGGALVVGSGNLTERGMRTNTEIFTLEKLNKQSFKASQESWNAWFSQRREFLINIDEKVVDEKAAINDSVTIASSKAKRKVRRTKKSEEESTLLDELFKIQNGVMSKFGTADSSSNESAKEEVSIALLRKDNDVLRNNDDYWIIGPSSSVLLTEIPKTKDRKSQANFSKKHFYEFFSVPSDVDVQYRILLRNVKKNGKLADIESRKSVKSKSRNFRFELNALKDISLPDNEKHPICVFAKVNDSSRDFLYQLIMPDDIEYKDVSKILGQRKPKSKHLRRKVFDVFDIYDETTKLNLWKYYVEY